MRSQIINPLEIFGTIGTPHIVGKEFLSMEIFKQIALIFGLCLAGEFIAALLPIAFPASVIAMLLLLALLTAKIIRPDHIREKSDFLLKNMAFFFIPSGVAIMANYDFIRNSIGPLVIICIVTTILTFGATAWTVKTIIKWQNKTR